ncbi:SMP-30/gluconolactonase/LRE family protein [Gracilimonas sp. Q87]|uniref:SMP-30/gluconolactonase/LRE family protein n=1 Tax=Gracilimonas sp. Q87 TaxID=3384766 RepID=UPI0039844F44
MKNTVIFRTFLLSTILLTISCISDEQFSLSSPDVVTSGYQFTEGPHWLDDGSLIFSDIPANKVYQWRPGSSETSVFIDSSGRSNGIEGMPDGTVVLTQHDGRVSKLLENGKLEIIVTEYKGMRLNSPNDLAIRSDSLIYFTDPPFGVSSEDQELDFAGVYRIDKNGELILLYDQLALPNGIAFSPDESFLYLSDSETGDILKFEVLPNGDLFNEMLFANIDPPGDKGAADGMITDSDGRLYTTGPNGLTVFDTEGKQLSNISFEEQITNVEWGSDESELYITAANSVYRVMVTK